MAINPMQLMAMRSDFAKFNNNHPKFIRFVQTMMQSGLQEGTVLECKVIQPDGREMQANIKITQDDLELIQKIKGLNI